MIASMAKAGIDRQASGAVKFPVRHRLAENVRFEMKSSHQETIAKTRQAVRG
jgi:hypothetical protein